MSEPSTDLVDLSGVVRFRGHFVPPVGGAPSVQADYYGEQVAVDVNASAPLTWDHLISATDLLDRTDPSAPFFIDAGTYAVNIVAVSADAFPAPLAATVESGGFRVPMFGSSISQAIVTLTYVLVASAGQGLEVSLTRAPDGGAMKHFGLTVSTIVKLS